MGSFTDKELSPTGGKTAVGLLRPRVLKRRREGTGRRASPLWQSQLQNRTLAQWRPPSKVITISVVTRLLGAARRSPTP